MQKIVIMPKKFITFYHKNPPCGFAARGIVACKILEKSVVVSAEHKDQIIVSGDS